MPKKKKLDITRIKHTGKGSFSTTWVNWFSFYAKGKENTEFTKKHQFSWIVKYH